MVPEGWRKGCLGEGIELISGQHVDANLVKTIGKGIPYLTGPADFPNNKIIVTKYSTEGKKFSQKDDTLITVKGSGTGKIVASDGVYAISRQLMAIRPKDIFGKFAFYTLAAGIERFEEAATGLIPGISREDVLNKSLLIPPYTEQRKIAKILQTWDRAIAITEKLIDASKQQKKALMQQLLTGKKRFAGFEGEWEKVRLGDLCTKITDGAHHSPKSTDSGFPMYSVKDMGKTRFKNGSARLISKNDYEMLVKQNCKPEINDILIANDGPILKNCFVVRKEVTGVLLSSIALLRPNIEHVYPEYIAHYFSQDYVKKFVGKAYTTGSGVPRIVLKDFKSIKIPLPSKEEQRKISEILSLHVSKTKLLEKELTHLKEEKKALMQQLLTGKRRVKVDE